MQVPDSPVEWSEDWPGQEAGQGEGAGLAVPAALAVIWPLLGRHIAFHRRLVDLTDNVKAALLLSQSIYWSRRGRDIGINDGWFHKTAEQWTLETGLSVKEQQSAREQLRKLALLEDQRMGLPAKLHFRLDLDELGRRLSAHLLTRHSASQSTVFDLEDRMVLAELLGPSVAFHRTLAGLAGGVHGGLLLSRALHLTRQQARRRLELWIDASVARWHKDLGLSRRAQEAARRDLQAIGLWEERLSGMPPSLVARVRLEALCALLSQDLVQVFAMPHEADSKAKRGAKDVLTPTTNPVGGKAAIKVALKGETSMWDSHHLDSPKPPSLFDLMRHHSLAESVVLNIEQSTGDSLQPQQQRRVFDSDGQSVVVGDDLIFAEQLLPDEREAARRLLRNAPMPAQVLLDELAGRLRNQGVRSPLAYLRGLIQRARAGTFVPELAPRVADERDRRASDALIRQQRAIDEAQLAAQQASPEYQQRVQAGRERARALLVQLKQEASNDRPGLQARTQD